MKLQDIKARPAIGRVIFGIVAMSALSATCGQAMTIRPVFDSSITSLSNAAVVESAFDTVANDYAKSFSNVATINIDVSWGSVDGQALPSNAVGASVSSLYGYYSYSQIKSLLATSSSSNIADTALATAVKNLPVYAPSGVTNYVLPSSEAKALGLSYVSPSATDGYIGFAGSTSGYDFAPADGISSTTYDFQAVAAHEIDEVLGRISGLSGSTPSYRTVFDLFRYSAPGVISDSYTTTTYFSIDGGKTKLATFNNSTSGGDRSDWATYSTSTDIQDAFISKGKNLNLTAVDLTGLDVLGYGGSNIGDTLVGTPGAVAVHLITAVPEPSTWTMLLIGFGGLGAMMRSSRKVAAAAPTR
jgi:hypothetical protein